MFYALDTEYLMLSNSKYEFISEDGSFTDRWKNVKRFSFLEGIFYRIFNWNVEMVDVELQVLK